VRLEDVFQEVFFRTWRHDAPDVDPLDSDADA
jgi:hypothetical protein